MNIIFMFLNLELIMKYDNLCQKGKKRKRNFTITSDKTPFTT